MSIYRTRTYIAADFDNDRDAVDQLEKWNNNNNLALTFSNAHVLMIFSVLEILVCIALLKNHWRIE